jgi:hypothetical protein
MWRIVIDKEIILRKISDVHRYSASPGGLGILEIQCNPRQDNAEPIVRRKLSIKRPSIAVTIRVFTCYPL